MENDNRKIAIILLATSLIGLIYISRKVLTPFIVSFTIAYLLDPLVDRLEARGVSRVVAVVILIGAFFSLALATSLLLFPVLQDQVQRLAHNIPQYVEVLQKMTAPLIAQLSLTEPGKYQELIRSGIEKFGLLPLKAVSSASSILWSSFSELFNLIFATFSLVIIPVAMFYLLCDYDEINRKILSLAPPRHQDKIRKSFLEIDRVLANFMRGQLMVSGMMAALYIAGLFLCETPLSLIIGIVAGLANLVPYLGFVFGLIPAAILTYLHHQELTPLVGVITVFGVVQSLEGMVLTPRIVGDQIGLHPLAIMLAVLLGADLFGLMGLLLAVPSAAVVNVLVKRGLDQYRKSSFYS